MKRLEKINEIWYNICTIKVKNAYVAGEMKEMNKPQYIDWLIEEKGIVLEGTHEVQSYRIDYSDNPEVIDDWALHIRRNYIKDQDLVESAEINGLTIEQYLKKYIMPQKGEPLGSTARSGDIAEIVVSDLLEFVMGYTVPRYKQMNRSGKNNSEHGTDIIGYKFYKKDKSPNEKDELVAAEVKAELTSEGYSSLKEAIKDSRKDEDRLARTIDYCRKKLRYQNDFNSSKEIERFLIKPENNFKIIYIAAGVSSRGKVDTNITLSVDGEDLRISNGQAIFFIHGQKLMDLTHKIYERCSR